MEFYKDKSLNRYYSKNGMWMIDQNNGEYVISIKTNEGAWKEVCSYPITVYGRDTVNRCKEYIEYVCSNS